MNIARPEAASDIAADVAAVGRIQAVPTILRMLCRSTGMGFAAVARVTADRWTACAVQDDIAFGLQPGGELDVHTTLCKEVRESRKPIVIDHASRDPAFCRHPTPRLYAIESYVSVPIFLGSGEYFGNLCAIDPQPRQVSAPQTVAMFELFAQLLGLQLENERQREQVEQALLDERATGELREQFMAVLGHDLRNPLSSIANASQLMLLKAGEPAEVRRLATKTAASVRRMVALIENLTDFARGRLGGGIALDIDIVEDLQSGLLQTVAELREAHPGRRLEAAVTVVHPLRCDPARLQQLVANLLVNALQHGAPEGRVELRVAVEDAALVIEVRNEGEPIPPAHLGLLFKPFWRPSSTQRRGGLGLGLHICNHIVRAHGGELQVTSSRAEGTRFRAVLPIVA